MSELDAIERPLKEKIGELEAEVNRLRSAMIKASARIQLLRTGVEDEYHNEKYRLLAIIYFMH